MTNKFATFLFFTIFYRFMSFIYIIHYLPICFSLTWKLNFCWHKEEISVICKYVIALLDSVNMCLDYSLIVNFILFTLLLFCEDRKSVV